LTRDPTRLNGNIVKVRGYLAATDHGNFLGGECKAHLVTRGLAWGNLLSLHIDPAHPGVIRSWKSFSVQLTRLHADPRRDGVWVTVVGRLETRASMDDEVIERPWGLQKAGFGHMGGCAAEIDVLSLEGVVIERGRAR
jgi:hypothetical protein